MITPFVRTATLAVLLSPLASAATLHVDAHLTTGLNDGSSWADAFQGSQGLQAALAAAVSSDEIWVADGIYTPTAGTNRAIGFALKNGVTLYGSFAGGEASPAERPLFGTSDSVLSGDLSGDDDGGSNAENSHHVITTTGTNATAIIDGFVVTAGNANLSGGNRDRGAGIICTGNVGPTVRRCRFIANNCTFGGAAGYVNSGGFPTFTDCTFEDGNGGSFGGAFDVAGGGPVRWERCLFVGNRAGRGGALEIFSTNGTVVNNCVFRDNLATSSTGGGGGLWIGSGGNTQVRNCTIVSNTSTNQNVAGLRNQSASNVTISNCIFWDNTGPGGTQTPSNQVNNAANVDHSLVMGGFGGTGGIGNVSGDPQFLNAAAGVYRISPASPAIDAGDSTMVPLGTTADFAGDSRLVDAPSVVDTGVGPAPVVDMGAFEFQAVSFLDLGIGGLAGTPGVPSLTMAGPLTGGSQVDVAVANALPSSTAYAVAGFGLLVSPLKGGILVPSVDVLVPLPTDGAGELAFSFSWPGGVPGGALTFFQFWVADPAGPFGFSATSGVQGTTP